MSAPSWAGMSTGESSCTPHLVKEIKRESGSQSDGAYDVDFDTLGQSSRCSQSHSRSLLLGSERYDSSKGGSRGAEGKLVHSFTNKNYSSLKTPSFPTKTLLLTQNSFIPYKNPHSADRAGGCPQVAVRGLARPICESCRLRAVLQDGWAWGLWARENAPAGYNLSRTFLSRTLPGPSLIATGVQPCSYRFPPPGLEPGSLG